MWASQTSEGDSGTRWVPLLPWALGVRTDQSLLLRPMTRKGGWAEVQKDGFDSQGLPAFLRRALAVKRYQSTPLTYWFP